MISFQKLRAFQNRTYQFDWIENGELIGRSKKTEHDTIFENEDTIIIIDAKMYNASADLWNDHAAIRKQSEYYNVAHKMQESKKIFNVFMKPYFCDVEKEGYNGSVPGLGYKFYGNKEDFVIIYAVPFEKVMEAYYYGKKLGPELLTELKSLLQNNKYYGRVDLHTYTLKREDCK